MFHSFLKSVNNELSRETEENGHGLFTALPQLGTYESQEIHVRIVGTYAAATRTRDLRNAKKKCPPLDHYVQ